jgi:EAL domain-containing protein (putative c-di-GMP-specific phosphodiesterase class I)/PleD family two-component response regulator
MDKNYIEALKFIKEHGANVSVLLVEDDSMIREEYKDFFSKLFNDVQTRKNGQEGLDAYTTQGYDIVITDLQMPVLNGLEMIKQIKEQNPKQHILLISAHQESEYLHQAMKMGVDGYLFKPMNLECTIEALRKIISQIVIEHENYEYKNNLESLVEQKSKALLESYTLDDVTKLYSLAKLQKDINTKIHNSFAIFKIKNFKSLNDFYGYEVGDFILKQTADIMRNVLLSHIGEDKNYTLYRMSGAHFGLMAPRGAKDLELLVRRIIQRFELQEINVSGQMMYLDMNAAIVCSRDGVTLSKADRVLREAEKSGKVVVFTNDVSSDELHQSRLACNDSIKRAIKDDRFIPYYQAIVDNNTNTIQKYEALARMIMPDGEVITPDCFLTVSKQTKNYNAITQAIIRKALDDFRDSECAVSLNLSIDDINHERTVKFILKEIANFPEPSRLVFELLESEDIESYKNVKTFFAKLKGLGCKVAIDDFGTGYSNFEHIAQLNVDYIKIDGSLILGIENQESSYRIVEMLSNFSKHMGIKTIAEYVSTNSIKDLVNKLGVGESQGYLFAKPMPFNGSMKKIQSVDSKQL